jgi:hypothetical protein
MIEAEIEGRGRVIDEGDGNWGYTAFTFELEGDENESEG